MTDQDWEVDGAAGAAANGGGAESQAAPEGPRPPRPTNVVPFPGNWFGSIDELVPLGTGANAATAAADANAFWDGEALPLEELAPPDVRAAGPPTAAAASAQDTTALAEGPRADIGHVAVISSRRLPRVALLCTVLLAAVAGGVLLLAHALPVGGHSPSAPVARTADVPAARVLTETVTAPLTVTTRAAVRTRQRGAGPLTGVKQPKRTAQSPSRRGGRPRNSVSPSVTRGSAVSQLSTWAASPTAPASSGATSPPTAGGLASGTSADGRSQSGCAQSPDSGCLP